MRPCFRSADARMRMQSPLLLLRRTFTFLAFSQRLHKDTNCSLTRYLQLTRNLFARLLLAVWRGLLWEVQRVFFFFFLCLHWVQWIKFLINLVKLSSDDVWLKWNIQSRWFREDGILWVANTSAFTAVKVARTYLYASWLCFRMAFFGRNDLSDFYDFKHP